MYQFLFKSRWIALGFVALTLLSVYMLVGGREDGVLSQAADSLASGQDANADRLSEIEAQPRSRDDEDVDVDDEADETVYMDDQDLIDEADGFDPTPQEASTDASEVSDNDSADFDPAPERRRFASDGVEIISRDR